MLQGEEKKQTWERKRRNCSDVESVMVDPVFIYFKSFPAALYLCLLFWFFFPPRQNIQNCRFHWFFSTEDEIKAKLGGEDGISHPPRPLQVLGYAFRSHQRT